jgi:signal transduction histidine kinase
VATGTPRLFPKITDDALRAAAHDEEHYRLLKEIGMGCGFSLPLRVGERTLGVLTLVWDAGRVYSDEDLALARVLADRAALALENARLYQKARTAEEDVRRLNGDLERRVNERTAELEAFTYTVAHDLRAPLRAMQGLSDLVLEDAGSRLETGERDYLKRVSQAAARMDTLVRDLLAYSRLGSAEVNTESVDLGSLVRDVLRGMDADLKARDAEVLVDGGIPRVLAQRPILFQVVANLLSNAVKFVSPGVVPRIRIRAEARGVKVRLLVEDNGIGVDPQFREKLFGVFERLHVGDAYPGTGIGLAIVKRAVERMGGQVGVESLAPRGSAFWFDLPQAPEQPARERRATDRQPAAPGGP